MAVLRPAALGLIHAYRLLLSPILPPTCRFEPTCSAYGLDAIRRFGAVAGGWLALRRLIRCHPWGGSGFDPVPDVLPVACRHPLATGEEGVCGETVPEAGAR
ncbi:MAG: membrane protein insertion efficiency factor YidD [Rhodospirillales bacterium]